MNHHGKQIKPFFPVQSSRSCLNFWAWCDPAQNLLIGIFKKNPIERSDGAVATAAAADDNNVSQ